MNDLETLFMETRLLFHRLRAVADTMHQTDQVTAGMRGVLESLALVGPQTVPQLARARPVSRQHIQTLVNALLDQGLVELIDNAAHKKSPLVQLTEAGARTFGTLRAREARLLSQVSFALPESDLATTIRTLQAIRRYFESAEWRRIAQSHHATESEAKDEPRANGEWPI
jgi:DNA-binding MarR family transcriptional regulator